MSLEAAQMNMRHAAREYEESGLTVTVPDLQKPNWRFNSNDKPVLEKWHAILQQVVEGKG